MEPDSELKKTSDRPETKLPKPQHVQSSRKNRVQLQHPRALFSLTAIPDCPCKSEDDEYPDKKPCELSWRGCRYSMRCYGVHDRRPFSFSFSSLSFFFASSSFLCFSRRTSDISLSSSSLRVGQERERERVSYPRACRGGRNPHSQSQFRPLRMRGQQLPTRSFPLGAYFLTSWGVLWREKFYYYF